MGGNADMKRTGFKPRKESMRQSYARRQAEKCFPARKAVSTLPKRKKAAAGDSVARKTPLRKVGKRGKKRQEMNAQLNKLGINHCEIGRPCCVGRIMLTWAHARKSRFLVTDTDWLQAARACIPCHNEIEAMSHAVMFEIVTSAIARR